MTRGSSINFKKSSAGFEHNDRTEEREPKHLLPEEFRLENECDRSAIEANLLLAEMIENAKKEYQERTGQKLQAKIFAVEAVINLEAHHALKDVEKINKYLEQKHGFRAIQSSIHRDEGHINDEGKPEYNLHAHVVYCNLDKDGKTILKGLEKGDFRELQTFVANALEMQRGQSAEITKAKHKTPQEFRYEKVLATQKDLKVEIAQLREQFKERGAERSEYAYLEQLNKEFKEQIKAKDLTIDQLKERTEQGQSLGEKYGGLPIRERLEMRAEMRAIVGESDGIEVGHLKKHLELSMNENKSLKEELKFIKAEQLKVHDENKNNRATSDELIKIEEIHAKEIKTLKEANMSLEEALSEKAKSPIEFKQISNTANHAIADLFRPKIETLRLVLLKKARVITVENLDVVLKEVYKITHKTASIIASNAPKIVDDALVQQLTKELAEKRVEVSVERERRIVAESKLEMFTKKAKETWENFKEAFKAHGSHLKSDVENLLDFSKDAKKGIELQKENRGLER